MGTMTHLRIEQNTITENVTSNVIHKLYETAKAIIDAEEANEVEESQVSLKGNLQVSKAYGDEIDWLEAKFPDLHINITTSRYIKFIDPEVLRVLLANNIGDGTAISETDITTVTKLNRMFQSNTTITSFTELSKFPITEFLNNEFSGCSNLQAITIPHTVTTIGEGCFGECTSMESIVIPNTVTTVSARALGANNVYWKSIVFEEGFQNTYTNYMSGKRALEFGVLNRNGELETLSIPDNSVETIGLAGGEFSASANFIVPAGIKWFPGNIAHSGSGVYMGPINRITFNDSNSFIGFYNSNSIAYLQNNPQITIQNIDWVNDTTSRNYFTGQVFFKANTYVNFPKNKISVIYRDEFSSISGLTNPVNDLLGDNIIFIGISAFANLGSRNEIITIPASCKCIGHNCFYGTKPTLFRILATTPPAVLSTMNTIDTSNSSNPGFFAKQYGQNYPDCRIQVPAESLELYKTTAPWNFYADYYDAIPIE